MLPKFQVCNQCYVHADCGGEPDMLSLAGCGSISHQPCEEWKWTCFCNPKLFAVRFNDVGDFRCDLRRPLIQPKSNQMPTYAPMLYHGSCRSSRLELPFAAVPLYALVRRQAAGGLELRVQSSEELRKFLKVGDKTKIIVSGVAPDEFLEIFWESHQLNSLLLQLSKLNIFLLTAPNFTFFSNAPLPHCAYNRARMLRIAERASDVSVPVALHLNSINSNHWRAWSELFINTPTMSVFCKEFQTGYRSPEAANEEYDNLLRFQQRVGRQLHPILIGGARFAPKIVEDFGAATIIDSHPFLRTYFRRSMVSENGSIRWEFKRTARRTQLDARLKHNCHEYQTAIENICFKRRSIQHELPFLLGNRNLPPQIPMSEWELFSSIPEPTKLSNRSIVVLE
jgi:hypothetical protein